MLRPEDVNDIGLVPLPENPDGDGDELDEGAQPLPETNSTASSLGLAAGLVGWAIYTAVVFAIGSIAFTFSFFIPLAVINILLVASLSGYHNWRSAKRQFTNPDRVNRFISHINVYEWLGQFTWWIIFIAIVVWNYVLGVLYLLFALFWNFALPIFIKVFGVLGLDFVPLLAAGIEAVITALRDLKDKFGSLNANNPGNFGSTQEETDLNDIDDLSKRMFQITNFFLNFLTSMEDVQWHEFVNFLADPWLKNAAQWYAFLADLAAMMGKSGAWSAWQSVYITWSSVRNALDTGACSVEEWSNMAACWLEKQKYNIACSMSSSIQIKCPVPEPVCRVEETGRCVFPGFPPNSERFNASSTSQIMQIIGTSCDEVECEYYVEDLFTTFNSTLPGCSFWTTNQNNVYDCMQLVNDYNSVNNTSPYQANPVTLAIEICIVLYMYNVKSCQDYNQPFAFSFESASNDICNKARFASPFAECSCEYPAPLCDGTCCQKYADHVNLQVIGQIGDYTCASLTSTFTADNTWCPLVNPTNLAGPGQDTITPFPDNTYAFMWCEYFQTVLSPACQLVSGFTFIRDLQNIAVIMPDFKNGACNLTVNQPSVCRPVNTTVDSLADDLVTFPNSFLETYNTINSLPPPAPNVEIPTLFEDGDDANEIVSKLFNKHFCQQYGQTYKTNNMIALAQPWSVDFTFSEFCDNDLSAAQGDLSLLGTSSVYKYLQTDGAPIAKTLTGVPANWPAFGSTSNPNEQAMGCLAKYGLNLNEKLLLDQCVQDMRLKSYANAEQLTQSSTELLSIFILQSNYTDAFVYSSGLIPIYPDTPNAFAKQQQRDRTINATKANVNYVDPPWQDLPPLVQLVAYNFTTPPSPTAFDATNPFAALLFQPSQPPVNNIGRITLSVETERITLSVETDKPVAPPYFHNAMQFLFGIDLTKKNDHVVEQAKSWTEASLIGMFGPATKKDKAAAVKTQKRMARKKEFILDNLYYKFKRQYEEEGHTLDNVDFFPTTRKLASTGNVALDVSLATLLSDITSTPHNPVGTSPENYNLFLQQEFITTGIYIARATATKVIPGIIFNLLRAYNMNSPPNMERFTNIGNTSAAVFGAEQQGPECRAIASDPYRCCTNFGQQSSYSCCVGLAFCLPDFPIWLYPRVTTAENIADKWKCGYIGSFYEWWTWLFKLSRSVIVSYLVAASGFDQQLQSKVDKYVLDYRTFPENLAGCMLVESRYFFFGLDILYAVYLLISIQTFSFFVLIIANFRQKQTIQDDDFAQAQAEWASRQRRNRDNTYLMVQGQHLLN